MIHLLSRLIAASAIALPAAAAPAGAAPAAIFLSCDQAAPGRQLCDRLGDALRDRTDAPILPAAPGAAEAAAPGALWITLELLHADASAIEARLRWRPTGTATGTGAETLGPAVTLGQSDAALTPDRFPMLIDSLLRVSPLPVPAPR